MLRNTGIVALATLLMAAGSAAQAADTGNDARHVTDARVSLVQAVQAAEREVDGRASRAEYERTRDGWAYDVEIVDGRDVMDVRVDPSTGKVIGSERDAIDHDDASDERD